MHAEPLKHFVNGKLLVAGCDEAGRGCLAGPVFAAAVILPVDPDPDLGMLLNDSKKLTHLQRVKLKKLIGKNAVSVAVGMVDHTEIDRINILQASIKAMHLALERLNPQPGYVIVDGNRFIPYGFVPHQCMIKGDATWLSVAAASILAKTARDDYMCRQHLAYPAYGWDQNKGYPTAAHRAIIKKIGPSPIHRKSFRLL